MVVCFVVVGCACTDVLPCHLVHELCTIDACLVRLQFVAVCAWARALHLPQLRMPARIRCIANAASQLRHRCYRADVYGHCLPRCVDVVSVYNHSCSGLPAKSCSSQVLWLLFVHEMLYSRAVV